MMSSDIKENILDALFEDAYEFYYNDGFRGEQCCILAREDAKHRYDNGEYDQSYYEAD
jgi:hypothetical protein